MKKLVESSMYDSCMELREILKFLEEDEHDLYFEEFIFEVQAAYIRWLGEQELHK